MVEYAVGLALMIAACVTEIKRSDLPPAQKERLIHNIESWKSLPPTKKNLAYVEKNSAQIRKLLATASNPASQAALDKYTTKGKLKDAPISSVQKSGSSQTPKSNLSATPPPARILGGSGPSLAPSGSGPARAGALGGTNVRPPVAVSPTMR